MLFIIATAALGILPIALSAVCGVLLMLTTGCLKWFDATRALSAPVVLIIAASLAMGTAMVETGGAAYLASVYVLATEGFSPVMILSGLLLSMAVLTNIVSNNAAAVIGTPIAFGISKQLGLPPEPFVLAVIFGANMSFATPMAYQTNLLVMNAGNYKFSDFLRVGLPLALLMWITLSLLLPWLYDII
jgi:di/tricarboxylate transporter